MNEIETVVAVITVAILTAVLLVTCVFCPCFLVTGTTLALSNALPKPPSQVPVQYYIDMRRRPAVSFPAPVVRFRLTLVSSAS